MNEKGGFSPILIHVSYYSRRIALALVCIYWSEMPLFQIFTVLGIDLISAILLANYRPGISPHKNKLNMYDDISLILIIQCLICCTDLNAHGESRYMVGFIIAFVTLQNVAINLILILIEPLRRFRLWMKWCLAMRRQTKGKSVTFAKKRIKDKFKGKLTKLKTRMMVS